MPGQAAHRAAGAHAYGGAGAAPPYGGAEAGAGWDGGHGLSATASVFGRTAPVPSPPPVPEGGPTPVYLVTLLEWLYTVAAPWFEEELEGHGPGQVSSPTAGGAGAVPAPDAEGSDGGWTPFDTILELAPIKHTVLAVTKMEFAQALASHPSTVLQLSRDLSGIRRRQAASVASPASPSAGGSFRPGLVRSFSAFDPAAETANAVLFFLSDAYLPTCPPLGNVAKVKERLLAGLPVLYTDILQCLALIITTPPFDGPHASMPQAFVPLALAFNQPPHNNPNLVNQGLQSYGQTALQLLLSRAQAQAGPAPAAPAAGDGSIIATTSGSSSRLRVGKEGRLDTVSLVEPGALFVPAMVYTLFPVPAGLPSIPTVAAAAVAAMVHLTSVPVLPALGATLAASVPAVAAARDVLLRGEWLNVHDMLHVLTLVALDAAAPAHFMHPSLEALKRAVVGQADPAAALLAQLEAHQPAILTLLSSPAVAAQVEKAKDFSGVERLKLAGGARAPVVPATGSPAAAGGGGAPSTGPNVRHTVHLAAAPHFVPHGRPRFTIMSQPLLRHAHEGRNDHPYVVDEQVLSWEYRRSRLIDSIASAGPDIVCLQDLPSAWQHCPTPWTEPGAVGHDDCAADVGSALTQLGYEGVYVRQGVDGWTRHWLKHGAGAQPRGSRVLLQPAEACPPSDEAKEAPLPPARLDAGGAQPGVAVFWRKGVFKSHAVKRVRLSAVYLQKLGHVGVPQAGDLFHALVQSQPAVAALALLQHIPSGKPVLAVSTRLCSQRSKTWRQMIEMQAVAQAMGQLAVEVGGPEGVRQAGVALGCNLNSTPAEPAYRMATGGDPPSVAEWAGDVDAPNPGAGRHIAHVDVAAEAGGQVGHGPVFELGRPFDSTLPWDYQLHSAHAAVLGQEPNLTLLSYQPQPANHHPMHGPAFVQPVVPLDPAPPATMTFGGDGPEEEITFGLAAGAVDFILHSPCLVPLGVQPLPPADVLTKETALPNRRYAASDHLPLVATYGWAV